MRNQATRSVLEHRVLLELSRLVAAGNAGIASDALPLLLRGLACPWGVAYRVEGDDLEMVANAGLPREVRAPLEVLALTARTAFPAPRSARTRRTIGEATALLDVGDAGGRAAARYAEAGWPGATAIPLAAQGRVVGVLVVAGVPGDGLDAEHVAFVEAFAQFLAPVFAEQGEHRDAPASAAPKATQDPAQTALFRASLTEAVLSVRRALVAEAPVRASAATALTGMEEADALTVHGRALSAALDRVEQILPKWGSAPEPAPRRAADVGRVAMDAVAATGVLLRRSRAEVRMAVDEGCHANADAGALTSAIVELITNAADAVGDLKQAPSAPSTPRHVRVSVRRSGNVVIVDVDDSGRGVPPDLRARVFEPGFSTKSAAGQGLALVRRVVREHAGHVELTRSDLGGARFRVALPATDAIAAHEANAWRSAPTLPQIDAVRAGSKAIYDEDDPRSAVKNVASLTDIAPESEDELRAKMASW